MLNQFYRYLRDKLINFFDTQSLSGGERFYLQFDDKDQVEEFYETLREYDSAKAFHYQHEQGSPYYTFGLKSGDITVVVAATIENVTPDFLVTLRNEVGEQTGKWENTALLSICHETLDSIRGGSSDLQKEGMPFHVKSITKTLREEIDKSRLSKTEKEIVKFNLDGKLEDMIMQPALNDFAEILGLLSQGSIEKSDYPSLELFYDEQLDQYTPAQMKKRLKENHAFFEKVQHIHEYDNLDQQLEKNFDDKGVNRLKKDDWRDADYSFVKNSNEILMNEDKKTLEYMGASNKQTSDGLYYWEKPLKDTKAGNRKRHLIIFNPDKVADIHLQFAFDEYLKQEYIHKKSKSIASVSGKKLNVDLIYSPDEANFYRVTYKHKNQNKSTYDFYIVILQCHPDFLEPIQTLYEVKSNDKRIVVHGNGDNVLIGDEESCEGEYTVDEKDEIIDFTSEKQGVQISTTSQAWSDDSLSFKVRVNNTILPFIIKDQVTSIPPVLSKQIWKFKREKKAHFIYEEGKLKQGTLEYYPRDEFKRYLRIEERWIQEIMVFAEMGVNGVSELEARSLSLPDELMASYRELVSYYKDNNLLPSLAYFDDTLQELSQAYVDSFIKCVETIQENAILRTEEKNIFKLGTIEESGRVLLTPIHPLNVAYQLSVKEQIDGELVGQHILNRLSPNNLLPYIFGDNDDLYRPVIQQDAREWMIYEPLKRVSVGESNAYMANVVEEKLQQFIEHFNYLFLTDSTAPLRINVINVTNDREVLRGIFYFIKKRVEKYGPYQITPLEIALYQETEMLSSFEEFSIYDDISTIEEKFDISLTTSKLDSSDMLRIVRENISYYKLPDVNDYNYAHISFYKMISNNSYAKDNMEQMETGLSLNGILSSITSVSDRQDYRTGFGMKNVLNQEDRLVSTAYFLNELASNLENEGSNPYRKQESIVTRSTSYKEESLNALYDASYWVTFIDPNVGLDYFQRTDRDLLIIHYSDQYSSSDQYDAITVTNKSSQYRDVIKQYLEGEHHSADDNQINTAIRAFNSINGEWLLRIIGSKGHFSREKLSIISAIKYSLSYLNHDNILWVPISLEEILRVAGVVKLTKSEGVFSAKNLGIKGATSDDLLMMGLEIADNEEIYIHYYPVEVKIGLNQSGTIAKAKEQISTTRKLLDDQLQEQDDNGEKTFKNSFFRNFFIQMFMANAQKFIVNGLWPEKDFSMIEDVKSRLLNDSYHVGYHLKTHIGKGMVLSFKSGATWRSARKEEGVLLLELAEEDAYSGVVEEIEKIKTRIYQGKTDISISNLLANTYQKDADVSNPEPKDAMNVDNNGNLDPVKQDINSEGTGLYRNQDSSVHESGYEEERIAENNAQYEFTALSKEKLEDVQVLLGTAEGSTQKIFWEYGHPELANRHILVSGKSGQGKTYFMQCLLLELATNKVSSIIVDYTGGFKKSKLEPQFKDYLDDKLSQILVARDNFPINPFKRNQKELDEDEFIKEDFSDVADRMKGVFASIYKDLGIQQLNAIYQAIINGMSKYGDKMNLEILREELEEDGSGPAKTALSQLNPMIDKNPFDYSHEFDWSYLEHNKGQIMIIQLTGFASDVQKMITEFILWDLWHYKLQHGDQTIPLPVILDEAQNLDHSEKSPSAKILTEGRKFGWSGWYATQFLKGQLSTDQISRLQNSSEKVYFLPPENELPTIASNLSRDNVSKKEWEKRLAALNKGQCVAYGPTVDDAGELKQGEPVIVDITPLNERIRMLEENQ